MKITDAPALITTPFAQNGTRNDIPATVEGLGTGRASLTTGFPDETMKPITAGGVPPFGADFNGILYALSNAARFYGAGGHYKFNADFAAKIGGYPMGATVQASDNMGHWLNVVESNSTNPESALSTGWLPLADHNGTATISLSSSTTLTPLQAAKANIRFTGTPSGNVTVTFPAWTKRYSIINDCAGDGAVICTTGNGESVSIKNGAKYEVGCDGKNLTVATVNASQVFAEPNKNVSALDAPTVQQIINALGSAAAHAAGDFDASGCADAVQQNLDRLNGSLSSIAKSGKITDALGDLPWDRVAEKPPWTNNIYTGDGDTVLTSKSGKGKLSINDEWINFFPSKKGSCFAVGPDGRIYNSQLNHDQVIGLGSAALTPSSDYEVSGEAARLRNSLSEVAFTGAWASLNNVPPWVPRIYAGDGNSATGMLSSSGKTRVEVTDEWLNFFPVSGQSPKLTIGTDGILRNCTLPLPGIIGWETLASKDGTAQLVVVRENCGYIKFENGTILQFATGGFDVYEASMFVEFPLPFPNACLWASVSTRLLNEDARTDTWFQLISWDSYTAKVFRQTTDSGVNRQPTAPYVFAVGR